jgi:5'-nucleotidase
MYKETVYNNPVEASQEMVRILKKEQKWPDHLPFHLGYNYKNEPDKICDLQLAALTQDIDLIIGGHTHTFFDKPTVTKTVSEKKCW